jgi:hypothetical protein
MGVVAVMRAGDSDPWRMRFGLERRLLFFFAAGEVIAKAEELI